LHDAQTALENYGLTVENENNKLLCFRDNSPRFSVHMNTGEDVQIEAKELGAENPNYRSRLSKCDRRFEVSFDSLDEVLNEINTLIDIQFALQEITEGVVFTSWNGIIEI